MVVKAVAQLVCRDTGRSTFGPVQVTNAAATGLQGDDLQSLVVAGANFEAWQVADFSGVGHRRRMGCLNLAYTLPAAVVAIAFNVIAAIVTLDQHHAFELIVSVPFQRLAWV